jgi:hypothetical protein
MRLDAAPEIIGPGQGALGSDRREHEGLLLAGAGLGEGAMGPPEQRANGEAVVDRERATRPVLSFDPGEDGQGAPIDRQEAASVLVGQRRGDGQAHRVERPEQAVLLLEIGSPHADVVLEEVSAARGLEEVIDVQGAGRDGGEPHKLAEAVRRTDPLHRSGAEAALAGESWVRHTR